MQCWQTIVRSQVERQMSNVNPIAVIGRTRGALTIRRAANPGLQSGVEGFDALA